MVSKYLIGTAFLLAGVNAERTFKVENEKDFKAALVANDKGYKFADSIKNDISYEDAFKTHSCDNNYSYLFMFKDDDKTHITCTNINFGEEKTFKYDKAWKLNGEQVKGDIKDPKHSVAKHKHEEKFEKVLKSLNESKKELKDAEAKENQTTCAIGAPKNKEEKVEYEWAYTIVSPNDYIIGADMTTIKILEKEYLAFCGLKETIEKKVSETKKEPQKDEKISEKDKTEKPDNKEKGENEKEKQEKKEKKDREEEEERKKKEIQEKEEQEKKSAEEKHWCYPEGYFILLVFLSIINFLFFRWCFLGRSPFYWTCTTEESTPNEFSSEEFII